jgi:peptidoglycan/xylan/chitin deacetylase (PgdA/CDA1 family)
MLKISAALFLILVALYGTARAQEIILDNSDPGFAAYADPAIPILMYHGLDQYTGSAAYRPEDFAAQMTYLSANGFQTITLDHLTSYIQTGLPVLPPKPIVLTFDDNYITIYTVAFPELQSRGFTGVNFAHTHYVGVVTSYDHADWNEIREMEAAGVIFTESHTVMHYNLTTLNQTSMDTELVNSKNVIQTQIPGKICRHLAYPYGGFNATVIARTQAAGYVTAVSTNSGTNNRTTPVYELKRYGVNPDTAMNTFTSVVNAGLTSPWTAASSPAGYYGSNYIWAPALQRQSVATWSFTVPQAGAYQVYARWPAAASHATNAPYRVTHAGGETTTRVNQQGSGGTWVVLGQYQFEAATPYSVKLGDDADGRLAADAVRIVPAAAIEEWGLY